MLGNGRAEFGISSTLAQTAATGHSSPPFLASTTTCPNESISDSGDVFVPLGVDRGVLLLQRCADDDDDDDFIRTSLRHDDTRETLLFHVLGTRSGARLGTRPVRRAFLSSASLGR